MEILLIRIEELLANFTSIVKYRVSEMMDLYVALLQIVGEPVEIEQEQLLIIHYFQF